MGDATYNHQIATRYLLGALPKAEIERLDELSFTNEEFAESLSATEKDLVDAYIQGELSGELLEQFKSHYLASPRRREKVAFAQAFHIFAERSAADLGTKKAVETKRGWFAALSAFMAPRPALQWGLAAGVLVLLIGGGWLVFQNVRLRQQESQSQARRDELQRRERELEDRRAVNSKAEQELAQVVAERERLDRELKKQGGQQQSSPPVQTSIASFILSPSLRGAGQAQSVSIPPNAGRVAMQLNLEPNDYQGYNVTLIDQSNHKTIWRSSKLKASSSGNFRTLNVGFSASLLKPQAYTLQVFGISHSGASEGISSYPFKVVK